MSPSEVERAEREGKARAVMVIAGVAIVAFLIGNRVGDWDAKRHTQL